MTYKILLGSVSYVTSVKAHCFFRYIGMTCHAYLLISGGKHFSASDHSCAPDLHSVSSGCHVSNQDTVPQQGVEITLEQEDTFSKAFRSLRLVLKVFAAPLISVSIKQTGGGGNTSNQNRQVRR